jgi:hypothetical protein
MGQFGNDSDLATLVDDIAELSDRTAKLRARAIALGERRIARWLRRAGRNSEAAWDLANEVHRRALIESIKHD